MAGKISSTEVGDTINFNAINYIATPIDDSIIVPCLNCDLNKLDCSGVACNNDKYIFKKVNNKK